MKSILSIVLATAISTFTISQEIQVSQEISWKKWYTHIEYIGQISGDYYLHQRNDEGWDGVLIKLDKNLNVVQTRKLNDKFFDHITEFFTKRFTIVGDHLIATYVARQNRSAVLCYDEYSLSDLMEVSKENIILRHDYDGLFHERMIQYDVLPIEQKGAIFTYKSWDLKKEKCETGVLALNKDLEINFKTPYSQHDLLGHESFFSNGRLNEQNEFQFINYTREANKIGLIKVSDSGELTTSKCNFESNYYFQPNLVKTGDMAICIGLYAEAFNVPMRGVFIATEKNDKPSFIAFDKLEGIKEGFLEDVNKKSINVEGHLIGKELFLFVLVDDKYDTGTALLIKFNIDSKQFESSLVLSTTEFGIGFQTTYLKNDNIGLIAEQYDPKKKETSVINYTYDPKTLGLISSSDVVLPEMGKSFGVRSQSQYPQVMRGNPSNGIYGSFEYINKWGRFFILDF